MEMTDTQTHEVYIKHSAQVVTTGRVENGWMWHCARFANPDGPQPTREAALAAAEAELAARIL